MPSKYPPGAYEVTRKSGLATTVLIVAVSALMIVGLLGFLVVGIIVGMNGAFSGSGRTQFMLTTVGLPSLLIMARGLWLARTIQRRLPMLRLSRVPLLRIDAPGIQVEGSFAPWPGVDRVIVMPWSRTQYGQPALGLTVVLRPPAPPGPYVSIPVLTLNIPVAARRLDLSQAVAAVRAFAPPSLVLLEDRGGALRLI